MRRLYYDYSVTLPDGTEDHLSLEPSRTVGEVVDLLRFNYPNPDGATDMALYCRGDAMPLTDALYSWDTKDIPLVFKKEVRPLACCLVCECVGVGVCEGGCVCVAWCWSAQSHTSVAYTQQRLCWFFSAHPLTRPPPLAEAHRLLSQGHHRVL